MDWCVYIILCSDGSLYTGITTDLSRRYQQHAGQKGAKYFRSRQPKQLVYIEKGHDRRTASQREAYIKALSRQAKLSLLASADNRAVEFVMS